jgi:hypothetical protein
MVAKLLEAPHYEDGPPQPAANGTAGEDGSISIPIERQAHALSVTESNMTGLSALPRDATLSFGLR